RAVGLGATLKYPLRRGCLLGRRGAVAIGVEGEREGVERQANVRLGRAPRDVEQGVVVELVEAGGPRHQVLIGEGVGHGPLAGVQRTAWAAWRRDNSATSAGSGKPSRRTR